MSNNTTFGSEGNITVPEQESNVPCGPPPGWTGPPPPGVYANAANSLMKIIPPIIILVGTFGNTLTVIVLFRQMRKLSSTAMFLLALAFSDNLFLFNAPLRRWIIAVWNEDIRHRSEIGCKFSVYLTYTSSQFSSWTLVAVTVERLVSVVWPHRVRLDCTPRISCIFITVIFLIVFGLNTHIFYGFGQSSLPVYIGQGFCEPIYEGYRTFWTKTYAWIDFTVVYAVPFGILAVANSVIVYYLRKTNAERERMSDRSNTTETKMVTIMLVLLSIVFFLCLTPVSIYFIYLPYWAEDNFQWLCINVYEYIRLSEITHFVFVITNLLGYVNASFNFVLYIISGSKYRSEIKALLLCRPSAKAGVFGGSSSSSQRRTIYSSVSTVRAYRGKSQTDVGMEGDGDQKGECECPPLGSANHI
ncbi:neuropeptide Y receptor type 6-like [Mercenaria mercenaria]|uniref:neuropeptide Y receptor type 6-like n=1 Tax=Mercenaria mercenaria TaxID=6596 RepID=UPI001E1D9131|nr:neuropeptide Y receptor type 6-like [Mercenaria mercenaria]